MPTEIRQTFRKQVMAQSAEDRLLMGAQMFDAAVAMAKGSLPKILSEAEQERQLFKRLYGLKLDCLKQSS